MARRRTKSPTVARSRHDPLRPATPPNGPALAEREQRKHQVLELYLKGWPVPMIAREVGIRTDAAQNAVKLVVHEYMQQNRGSRAEMVATTLAKIDQLERTYWDAWERSMQESVRTTTSREDTPILPEPPKGARFDDDHKPPPPIMLTKTKVGRRVDYPVGQVTFLSGIQWCIDKRASILGLNSPEKVDIRVHIKRIAEEMGVDQKYVEAQAYEVAKQWEHRGLPDAGGN